MDHGTRLIVSLGFDRGLGEFVRAVFLSRSLSSWAGHAEHGVTLALLGTMPDQMLDECAICFT
jgi:hypothetical protein